MFRPAAAGLLACVSLAAVTLETIETKANFEAIGVRVTYSGDDVADAAIGIRYRVKGEAAWREGHSLIPITRNRLAGSLFFLREAVTYEIEVTGARAVFPQPFEVTTRSSQVPAPGREYIVDANAEPGGDGGAAAPFRTVQAAAQAAQPGDTVRIRPGVYREEIRPPRSGRPEAWIRFLGDGPGVVMDGGETVDTSQDWTQLEGGVYSRPYGRNPRYMSLDAVRLYRHSSLANLRNRGDGIDGGFYIDSGTLYVKPPEGGALAGRLLRAAVLAYGFYVEDRSHIEIANLEIHHYNEMTVRFRNSHNAALRDTNLHDSRQFVSVDRGSSNVLVEGNLIRGSAVIDWPWEICHHDHDCSVNGVQASGAGKGVVIRWNRISGVYNGIYVGGWVPDFPEEWALENDVSENLITTVKDDAIEPECHAINLRIWGNVMQDDFVGVSLAPIETGPTWVLYNTVFQAHPHDKGNGQWLKISYGPSGERPIGQVRVYHNTAFFDSPGHNGWSSTGSGNMHMFNNIVACSRYIFENTNPQPYPPGNVWDYNNFFTTDPTRYVKWENRLLNAEAFRQLGFQRHGIGAPPRFRDAAAGDFRLLPDDPGIDRGLVLPGINDGYSGAAPDLGAFEYVP